ncbi:hypothetical protein J4212_00745 [Candidatus Woesearchaeota archaeon]|nr:hypothetical protein [Candidatus Woesearchaeota archaeon]
MCGKCKKITGLLLLVAGVLFLLQDLAIWDFWGLSWYTVALLIAGVVKSASCHCPDCNACCSGSMPAKGKKK